MIKAMLILLFILPINSLAVSKQDDLMRQLKKSMQYQTLRQKVIAENIARVNVPGAKARDLSPIYHNRFNKINLVTTSPKHIKGGGDGKFKIVYDQTKEMDPTKNNIIIEDQVNKAGENNADFAMSSSIYKKFAGLIRLAGSSR